MILITGGTGFIGKALTRQLVEQGQSVRILLRPKAHSPGLPRGLPVDVALSSLTDERGLRAAMVGTETIFHLASGEWRGSRASLMDIDIQGTRAVVSAAEEAGVRRIYYVSHLGSDRASAYAVFKAKAVAEDIIRRSRLEHTIIRTAIVYGLDDGFTTGLARLMHAFPSLFFVPGDGNTLLQPIWVEDLVTCLVWAMEDPQTSNLTVEIGGPEYLSFRQIAELVLREVNLRRRLVSVNPPYLRGLTVWLESLFPGLPTSTYWLDYLAANRTTSLDTVPRVFNLMPARMSQRLAYLRGQLWRKSRLRSLFTRR